MKRNLLVLIAIIVLAILAFGLVVMTSAPEKNTEKNYCEVDFEKTPFEEYVNGSSVREIQDNQKTSEYDYQVSENGTGQ